MSCNVKMKNDWLELSPQFALVILNSCKSYPVDVLFQCRFVADIVKHQLHSRLKTSNDIIAENARERFMIAKIW